MNLDNLKATAVTLFENLGEGWRWLTRHAASALTRFRAGEQTNMPADSERDAAALIPARSWAMLGGELFEDDERLVVRLEIPGLDRQDLNIEVRGDTLLVAGEKRFEREDTQGRWRVIQCAYGSFERVVPLPVPVSAEGARASYRNGVLRVALRKETPAKPRSVRIEVS